MNSVRVTATALVTSQAVFVPSGAIQAFLVLVQDTGFQTAFVISSLYVYRFCTLLAPVNRASPLFTFTILHSLSITVAGVALVKAIDPIDCCGIIELVKSQRKSALGG